MQKATPIITNFSAGEIDPRFHGRVDLSQYFNACRILENAIVLTLGGAEKRPGTYFIAEAKNSAKKVRLVPFKFSTTQEYILEFGHNYIRFYKDRGQIVSGGSPVEIVTTYTEAELFDLKFTQSADVLYIAHPAHAPAKLTRSSHTAWTITNISFTTNPFTGAGSYPSCVAFFEERLGWASTDNEPTTIWLSKSGDYENMTTGNG